MSTKIIPISDLQIGDIILSTTDAVISKAIRLTTFSDFSHARLYVGNGKVIEAVADGVVIDSLAKVLRNDLYAAVYRKPNLAMGEALGIVLYASRQVGKSYDASGAVGAGVVSGPVVAMGVVGGAGGFAALLNLINPEHDFYCSELVAFAYKNVGIKLNIFSSQTKPKDLSKSRLLKYVGHIK